MTEGSPGRTGHPAVRDACGCLGEYVLEFKLCPKDQGGVSLTRMWEGISGEKATHRGMRQQEQAIILVSLTLLGRSASHPEQGFSKTKVHPDHLWDLKMQTLIQ